MNISSNYNSSIIALAESTNGDKIDGQVSIFDLERGIIAESFPVKYDFGGQRLAISQDNLRCFVGSYTAFGLASYSIDTGDEIWRRKDLKGVQYIQVLPFGDMVFCGRVKVGHLLDSNTGTTIEKPRGVKRIYPSPFNYDVMVSTCYLELHSPFGSRIDKIPRNSSQELDCCFSDTEVVISECGGPIRCFSLEPIKYLWGHNPPSGSHYLKVVFNQFTNCFEGLLFNYSDHSAPPINKVVHFERYSGSIQQTLPLNDVREYEFCLSGTRIFTSDRTLIDSSTGEIKLKF
jgi:hypothetical protein